MVRHLLLELSLARLETEWASKGAKAPLLYDDNVAIHGGK